MEEDDYDYEEHSQNNEDGRSKKKKKKSKKSKRNLSEDFEALDNGDDPQAIALEDDAEEITSTPSKKKSSKKKRSRTPQDEDDDEDHSFRATTPSPGPSSKLSKTSPKKEKMTPVKSSGSSTTPLRVSPSDGINIISSMSHDDIELLLNKIEAECPMNDTKRPVGRESQIDWNKIAFSCYGAQQCKSAWAYLMNQTRKYRIMLELVQEVKYNLKADYHKFMRKNIESAPDFPKQPYALGGFQCFCKEKWDEYKNLQDKMNKKVENFLHFQRKCHERWGAMDDRQKTEYDQKAKLLQAEYKLKVREFYAKYPAFAQRPEKLNKEGKPEAKDKPMSDYYRKQVLKMTQEMFPDAPLPPLTPMQLFIQHKIKRLSPPPLPSDEPELKTHYMSVWKELSRQKKLKWIQKCIKYCERYQLEVTEYKKTHPVFMLPREFQISKLINKEEFGIWTEDHGQPPKPKNTIYEFFVEEFGKSPEAAELSEDQMLEQAKLKWSVISPIDKRQLELKFKLYSLTFRKELEEYISTVPDMLRTSVIDILPKKYKKQFLEDVDKEPLVKEEDMIEVSDGENKGTSKKRKATNDSDNSNHDSQHEGLSQKKMKKKKNVEGDEESAIPLYAQELGEEHKKVLDEMMREANRKKAAVKYQNKKDDIQEMTAGKTAKVFYPGKTISPHFINEAIRGIFDGRQFERRFTVYYYYAKYVAREKSWVALYGEIGIVETAARIIETFNRLSKHQQQVFLDEALKFHCHFRHYDKQFSSEHEILMPKLHLFPEEPKPPPRKASKLYSIETNLEKLKNPSHQAPSWEELDDETQMRYMKKVYKLSREYIKEYESFVMRMTPNDLIEYIIHKSLQWNVDGNYEQKFYDRSVFTTAEATRAKLAGAAYSLEMSDDGQESEPEVPENNVRIKTKLESHKFRYRRNPFSVRLPGVGVCPDNYKNSLIDRLSSTSKSKKRNVDPDLPSSTSDEDEEEYGFLDRSDTEKKKDKEFRRKLRQFERHYYPLQDCYEPFDLNESTKYNACVLSTKEGKKQALDSLSEQKDKWAHIRALIKRDEKESRPRPTVSKAKLKGLNTKNAIVPTTPMSKGPKRRVLSRQAKSTEKNSIERNHSPEVVESALMQAAIKIMKARKKLPNKGTALGQGNDESSTDDTQSEDDEVIMRALPDSTTPFIETAISRPASSLDEDRELSPELRKCPSPLRQPAFALVKHSPRHSPRKKVASKDQSEVREIRSSERAPRRSGSFPGSYASEAEAITPGTSRDVVTMSMVPAVQEDNISDEFCIIDSLATIDDRMGIFSESELNQLDYLNM